MRVTLLLLSVLLCLAADAATDQIEPNLAEPKRPVVVKAQACLEKALDTALTIEDPSVRRSTSVGIAHDLAYLGRFEPVRRVIQLQNDSSNARLLIAIMQAQAKKGDTKSALATFAEVRQWSEKVDPKDRKSVLEALFDGYMAIGQLAEADRIVSQYSSQAEQSRARVEIAEAFIADGRRVAAIDILKRVAANEADDEDRFFTHISEILWPLFLKLDEVDATLKVARGIERGYWVRCRILCAVGTYHLEKGNPRAAKKIFREALEAAKETGPQGSGISEQSARALEMLFVIHAHLEGGDIDGAVEVLNQMPNDYQKIVAFKAVAMAQHKAGNHADALASLRRASETIDTMLKDVEQNYDEVFLSDETVRLTTLIAEGQVEIGAKREAADTLAVIGPLMQKMNKYCIVLPAHDVAELQIRLGDQPGARKTMSRAVAKVTAIENKNDRLNDLNTLAEVQIDLGFVDEARKMALEFALPLVERADAHSDERGGMATLLARTGDLAEGYRLAKQTGKSAGYYARGVAANHVMAKDADEVLALAQKEANPVLRSNLYHGIAVAILKSAGIEAPGWSSADSRVWIFNPNRGKSP